MSDSPDKPKPGRPLAPVDAEQVRKLAKIGCTNAEIADWFECSEATITTRFQGELSLGRAGLKMSLRRMQFRSARGGSVPMLIHLGKHHLGQTDKVSTEVTGKDGSPLIPRNLQVEFVDATEHSDQDSTT